MAGDSEAEARRGKEGTCWRDARSGAVSDVEWESCGVAGDVSFLLLRLLPLFFHFLPKFVIFFFWSTKCSEHFGSVISAVFAFFCCYLPPTPPFWKNGTQRCLYFCNLIAWDSVRVGRCLGNMWSWSSLCHRQRGLKTMGPCLGPRFPLIFGARSGS